MARSYHDKVFSGKLRQAVRHATNREGEGCILPDNQCTKTGQPVAEHLGNAVECAALLARGGKVHVKLL